MKFACSLAVLGAVAVGAAQSPMVSGMEALRIALSKTVRQPVGNPMEPTGFNSPPPRSGELPPARPFGEDERQIKIIQSGKYTAKDQRVKITGGFHVQYKGYDLFGRELDADTAEEVFTLTGDVKVIGETAVVTGSRVTIYMKERRFRAEDSISELRPEFLKGRVRDQIYTRGGTAYGSENNVRCEDCGLTSCNLDHPHFEILSKSSEVRPGKRLILRHVTLKILDKDILRLPYLSIPLEDRSDRYLPEVGHTQQEGYYAKFKLPVPIRGDRHFLDARLDYYSKLGGGLGADYNYDWGQTQGYLKAYGLLGQSRTLSVDQSHSAQLGLLSIQVANNYQKQNYLFAPENTILNSRLNLSLAQAGGSMTGFTFYRTSNESPGFKSLFQTATLTDYRNWGTKTRTSLDLTLNSSNTQFSSSSSERSQLDVRFRGSHEFSKAQAELEYQRSIPIGDTTNFFGSQDRTPVLTLRSDSGRLLGNRWREALPTNVEFSVGEYSTGVAQGTQHITRSNLDVAVSRPDRNRGRWGMSGDARLRQSMYSNDTAQYTISSNSTLRYDFSRGLGWNVRYSYMQSHGYTPLSFDQTYRSNLMTTDLSFSPLRRLSVGAQTGYDFLQEERQQMAWQNVGARLEWKPADYIQLRGLSSYDPFRHSWSNIRLDLAYQAGDTFLAIGARYDGFRHTWGNVNVYLDGFKIGPRIKTSALMTYNGYLRKFESRHLAVTYDLHCAEAILQVIDNQTGFRPGTQVAFFIRLKAFPFDTPFGLGRRGQSIGTGTGRDGF